VTSDRASPLAGRPATYHQQRDHGLALWLSSPRVARRILGAPLVLFLLVFVLYPSALGVWISLTNRELLNPNPVFIGLDNFATTIADSSFWASVTFTLRFTVVVTSIALVTGFGLALLVHQRFPGKRWLFTALLLPIMIAPALMGIMFRLLLNSEMGLVPAVLGKLGLDISLFHPDNVVRLLMVLDILQWTPFTFLILYSGLQSMPAELYEAAAIDGASYSRALRSITLPLMSPILFAAGFLRAVDALRTFDVIYVLTGGGPGNRTTTVQIWVYKTAFVDGRFGVAAAASVVLMLLILPLVPWIINRVVPRRSEH
jgi:multiple sugar transport system permease protein